MYHKFFFVSDDNVESDLSISFSISEKLNIESLHIVSITSII